MINLKEPNSPGKKKNRKRGSHLLVQSQYVSLDLSMKDSETQFDVNLSSGVERDLGMLLSNFSVESRF